MLVRCRILVGKKNMSNKIIRPYGSCMLRQLLDVLIIYLVLLCGLVNFFN